MSQQITNAPNPPPPPPTCPECGAKLRDPRARRCWMCHEPLGPARGDEHNPFRLPEQQADNPAWAVFGVLAVLVFGGQAVAAPGVLLILAFLAVPALIRTLVGSARSRDPAAPVTVGSALLAFFSSLGVVAVVGVAAGVAFFVTCFAVCLGGLLITDSWGRKLEPFLYFAWILGGILALVVFVLLMRRLWPKKG